MRSWPASPITQDSSKNRKRLWYPGTWSVCIQASQVVYLFCNIIQIAVRDAYARVVAGAKDRIDQYLDTHPSGPSKDLDMRAWALAAYKIIYDCGDRFAIYQEAHLDSFDYYFDEDLVDEEIAEEFKSLVAGNVSASLGRRYSFAWLLSSEIFDLLREVDESSP